MPALMAEVYFDGEYRIADNCTLESVLQDNAEVLRLAESNKVDYLLIDENYKIDIDL